MAGGFAKDGAVQEQIDATLEDEVNRARSRLQIQFPEVTDTSEDRSQLCLGTLALGFQSVRRWRDRVYRNVQVGVDTAVTGSNRYIPILRSLQPRISR